MTNVVTRYKTNENGTGKIEARTGDLRRVVTFDHSRSIEANHGLAAGTVLLALDAKQGLDGALVTSVVAALAIDAVQHEAGNGVHRFTL